MLATPTVSFGRSIRSHNVALDVLADWTEASALFVVDEVSQSDVVDALHEEQIYEHPGSDPTRVAAIDRVSDAWVEVERRLRHLGQGSPLQVVGNRLIRTREWSETPDYAFCLLLSYAKWNREWWTFGSDYTEQGELFERLTLESMRKQFVGWEIHQTGWSRTHTKKLAAVVAEVAGKLGESLGQLDRWTRDTANEAGLDLLCYRPFSDGRVGVPVFLMQCASGHHKEAKFSTPNPQVWEKIIVWASKPKKAFATPFSFLDADFIRNAGLVNGLLLDRYRLLIPYSASANWLSNQLSNDLTDWLRPRIQQLPSR